MRLNLKPSIYFVVALLSTISYAQQITVDDSFTAQQLVENNLVQGCVEVTNINSIVNGNVNGFSSFGYFERAGSNFPFENGIMLSTGNANSAGNVQNTNPLNEGTPTWTTDPDLEAALGITNTLNATSIEFDFISTSSTVQFNYILASEEYFAEYPCLYSDGFAFLIREAGSGNPYQNIAMVPGTSIPVNTNTIHDEIVGFCPAENNQYFEGYNLGDTNFNGRTTVLTASASITPNVQYNIKLIVADQTDRNFDTAVFIEGNSFTDSVNLGDDITTCDASVTLNANTNNPQATYAWYVNSTIINGETSSSLVVNTDGNYTVEITVPLNNDTCTFEDTVNVALNTLQTGPTISDIEVCDDASNDGQETFDLSTKSNEIVSVLPPATYSITYHGSQSAAENDQNSFVTITSNSPVQPIYYNAQDTASGCIYIGTFNLIINPFPTITNPTPLSVCSSGGASVNLTDKDDEISNSNPNYNINYHFNLTDAESGANPIDSPYTPANSTETLFVSIVDITTGCSTTTTLDIEANTNPPLNPETQQLDACDQDGDGFDSFDLTENNDDVLQGLTNVTVTYHVTQDDANNGLNAITNPTNFPNTDDFVQVVFIRVEDNTTGCASIVPLELHTMLLESATEIMDFYRCDDPSNDGVLDFDLLQIAIEIINGLEDVTIDFYETEADQLANTNPIDQNVLYTVNNAPQTLYIVLNSVTCTYNSSIQLIINDGFEIQALTTQNYCDTDEDGFTSIDLTTFDDYVSTGIADATVTYFETQADADNNTNALPPFYDNTNNPLTVYVRVQNSAGCSATSALTIEVLPAPTTTTPNDIVICDDDQDGFSIINLTATISEMVTDTTNRTFTFHTSQVDAESNTAAITNETNYNADTQMVFCRIENSTTGCYSVEAITIYVNTLPVFDTISTLISCETDGNQIGEFIFSEKDTEILNGQTGKEVLYFTSQADADSGNNPIDKNAVFENTSHPQTIYVRVQNVTDANCFGTASFQIEVGSNPIYNAPTDVFVCDDVSNDGFETFDLTQISAEISQGSPETLSITYHLTIEDAEAQTNALPDNFTTTVNPQEVFATIDNGTFCKAIAAFEFNVIAVPETNIASALQTCDDDTDGFATFDLTVSEFEVLSVRQDNTEVQYYTSTTDLEQGTNQITNPFSFTNTSNPQTVYIKVLNTVSNCYAEIPLELIVEVPPIINDNVTINTCEDESFIYNLNDALEDLIDTSQTIESAFYASQADADAQQNPLDPNYTYTIGTHTIFIRAQYPGSMCFNIESFVLAANPTPTIGTIQDLQTCDDDFDEIASFNLGQQTASIIGGQNASIHTVNYFTSQNDAENNTNALTNLSVNSENNTIYYARIENNNTGCYNTTSFATIVNRKPELDIPNQVLCLDNLPLLVSAETNVSTDSYSWSTNSTNSYIEITEVGTYSVTVTTQFGCTNSTTFTVSESEAATIEFTETIDFSDPNNITIEVSGIGDYLYQFDDEEPQESNVFYNVPIGPHIITVIDLNGCNSTSKEVVIIDVPKFVTPNGDGYFDTWHITGVDQLTGTIVNIYDRYGKLLKTLTHTSQGWDGRYNGNLMPSNDYWYVADVKKGTVEFQIKGHFTLKL
ncbi:choice-of-anchor L domain-containing protein [Olleya sp. YS]|uniref:T9SS type B sorting domain-containing protein n=1 Tax=Olleya sp. YS TaxID=3028318 RepID=UPI0024340C3D|nr:choice-of-anchor L domain-containing protein [Olleya sp. YS]WGD33953.1 choice-of-anchor L domain-containing protein [Olleya sp. YS]